MVTGTPLREALSEAVLSTQTIDANAIEQAPSTRLEQLLQTVPGLQLFRRSDSRSGHPTSQGVTLRALGGNASSRALLTLDGVPQADPFGGWVNWPAYDPLSLARVRVTRGGGSVVAGPGALAGIIELESRAGSDSLWAGLEGGSRGGLETRVGGSEEVANGFLILSGSYGRGEGFIPIIRRQRGPVDERAGYTFANVRARYVRSVTSSLEAQVSASGFSDERDRGVPYTGNLSRGADLALRLVERGPWGWTALAYGQWRGFESSFASVDRGRRVATRVSLQDEVPSSALGGSFELRPPIGSGGELRLGGDVRTTVGHSHELYSYQNGSPTRERDSGGRTSTAGLYAEGSRRIGPLVLTAAGRLDRWRVSEGRLEEERLAGGALLTDERYAPRAGWLPTGRAGASADLGSGFTARTSAYLGWRLPTLNELFRPFRAGPDATAANPRLDPERLRGVEAGMQWAARSVTLGATLFANRLKDPITNVTLGRGPGLFRGVGFVGPGGVYRKRLNGSDLRVRGVELSGEVERGPWAIQFGYSFADASTGEGLRPAQTPRHNASARASWDDRGRSIAVQLRYVGAQFEDDRNSVRLPRATTVDLFGDLPIASGLKLVARAENLLDRRVVAGITGEGVVERATPRTVSIGLRFSR